MALDDRCIQLCLQAGRLFLEDLFDDAFAAEVLAVLEQDEGQTHAEVGVVVRRKLAAVEGQISQ